MTEPDVECFDQAKPVRDIALHTVRGIPGVAWAMPLLKIDTLARTRGGKLSTVCLLGVEDSSLVGLPRRMRLGEAESVRERDTVLIDPGWFSLLFPGNRQALGRPFGSTTGRSGSSGSVTPPRPSPAFPCSTPAARPPPS